MHFGPLRGPLPQPTERDRLWDRYHELRSKARETGKSTAAEREEMRCLEAAMDHEEEVAAARRA